jgi:predicted dehydrogenase
MEKVTRNKIVWGVIGGGDVCEKKSAPAMYKIPDSEIKAIMRRNLDKAEDFAKRHKIPNWYNQVDQILNDPEINAIYIATPPSTHAELTLKAAKAGKAVYVEKPMATSYQECLTMIQACEHAKVPLYVAYYRRALPHFLKIRDLINKGVIGEVRLVNIALFKPSNHNPNFDKENNWRVDPAISGGGYFHDLACHLLDFLDFLFGPINHATGIAGNQAKLYPADDIVTTAFSFESGILGNGTWCFTTANCAERDITNIVGSKGTIAFATFGDPRVILTTDEKGREEFNFEIPEHIQEPLIRLVVDDLLGTGTCPSTGVSAARTNLVMEKMCGHY